MNLYELIIIAIGLSMDAFAVAICKGLSLNKLKLKNILMVAFFFGLFQAAMPLIGYFLGLQFKSYIQSIDHWISFILLCVIGLKMIKEALSEKEEYKCDLFNLTNILILSLATSIDALAVGVTFAFLSVQILPAVLLIGSITFLLSAIGVKIGHVFGNRFQSKAELAGGLILIFMGTKILIQHLELIPYF